MIAEAKEGKMDDMIQGSLLSQAEECRQLPNTGESKDIRSLLEFQRIQPWDDFQIHFNLLVPTVRK